MTTHRTRAEEFALDVAAHGGFRSGKLGPPEPPFVDWFFSRGPGAPRPAAPPPAMLRWLLGPDEPVESGYMKQLAARFAAGDLLFGRCCSEGRDGLGRVIRARQLRVQQVPVFIDHAPPSVGVASVIPRPAAHDALALVILDASPRGRMAGRVVAQGTSGLSIKGALEAERGGWNEWSPFAVTEVSLVASPQDISCQVLALNHPRARDFLIHLGIPDKELTP